MFAENIAPLLVSPNIEQFSGAMFNKRSEAIQPSPVMTDGAYVRRFMEASDRLASKALGQPAQNGGAQRGTSGKRTWFTSEIPVDSSSSLAGGT